MSTPSFDEKDTPVLKTWIVSRLEDISDADSDVLADYVLALIKSDDPEEQARANCIDNLEDFLKEHTQKFVDDVFRAVRDKSYMPGYVPPRPAVPNASAPGASSRNSLGQLSHASPVGLPSLTSPAAAAVASRPPFSQAHHQINGNSHTHGSGQTMTLNQSMKRSRDESDGFESQSVGYNGDRAQKQRRRGGHNMRGGGRNDAAHSGFHHMPQMPPMPQLPAGFPQFDPNNPMAAVMAMQAMGMPPPLPDFGQFQSPSSAAPQARPSSQQQQGKSKQRCIDYDTKGFCAAGSQCPYEHGEDHIVVGNGQSGNLPQDGNSSQHNSTSNRQQSPPQNTRGSSRGNRGGRGRGNQSSNRGGRATFSSAGPNFDTRMTSVVVEQIPEDKFSDEEVRNFFQEFGEIEEISMQAYKRLAVVKFKDYASAKRAYESPKVIFDNRFVKVYWYKPDAASDKGNHRPSSAAGKTDGQIGAEAKKDDEEMLDPEEFAKKQAEAQQAYEEKMKKVKEAESAREELEKKIKAQADERKKLMEKLAAKTGPSVEPPSSINPQTPDARPSSDPASSDAAATATTESKMENQNVKETATENLRKKLAELEAEAETLGLAPDDPSASYSNDWYGGRGRGNGAYRGAYRGFGGYNPAYRGRGRGGWRGGQYGPPAGGAVARLDNRPKNVKVIALDEGVDFDDDAVGEALRTHLYSIGPFASIQPPPDASVTGSNGETTEDPEDLKKMKSKQRIVSFHERYVAEMCIASAQPTGGTIPGIGKVEMSWVANSAVPSVGAATSPTPTPAVPASATAPDLAAVGATKTGMPVSAASTAGLRNDANGVGQGTNQSSKDGAGASREDDYDVADDEDEDRWMMA